MYMHMASIYMKEKILYQLCVAIHIQPKIYHQDHCYLKLPLTQEQVIQQGAYLILQQLKKLPLTIYICMS